MRILWWQEPFWPRAGGLPIVAEGVLRRLRQYGDEIAVVTSLDSAGLPRRTEWEGIPVRRFPFWQVLSGGRIDEVFALRRDIEALHRELAPDVVHMNGLGPSALFHLESVRARRPPLLVSLHSSNTLSGAATALARQTLEHAHWVAACSRSLLSEASAAVPAIAGRASVVFNGLDAPPLPPGPLPAEPRVLCVGDVAPHKGFDLAVRALPLLLHRFPTLRLVVAGAGPSSGALARLAAREGVRDAVELLGAVGHVEVPRLMNAASVVAIPSRRESFSLVALEAALMARPVVAARVGGLPEIVAHAETGFLVEPESSPALASAIGTLLASPAAAMRLGCEARRRAQRHFGLQRQVDAYRHLHRLVVECARGAGSPVSVAEGMGRACE